MPHKDKQQRREYVRQWIAQRRAEFFKDKSCVRCGSTENLQLDHIDPSTKVSHRIWSWSQERRETEITKCQVLCKDCHLKKTTSERQPEHGTETMYSNHKCRCDPCRLARKVNKAKTRAKRKALGLPYQ